MFALISLTFHFRLASSPLVSWLMCAEVKTREMRALSGLLDVGRGFVRGLGGLYQVAASFLSLEWWLAQQAWSPGHRSHGTAWHLTRPSGCHSAGHLDGL